MAEQAPGVLEVAVGQRLAHGRTGDADAAFGDGAHLLDVEPELAARFLEIGKVAGAAGAKAEVIAHQHPARVQSVPEHVLDECLRGLGGEMGVEVFHDHAVHPVAAQGVELVAQQRDARGRVLGGEEFARMRLERHHTERQATGIRGSAGAGEQRLVAAMHTVEIADGERAGRPAFGVGQAAEDFHEDGGRAF